MAERMKERDVYVLKKDLEQIDATDVVRLVLYVW